MALQVARGAREVGILLLLPHGVADRKPALFKRLAVLLQLCWAARPALSH